MYKNITTLYPLFVCECIVPLGSVIMPQLVGFLASSSTFSSHSSCPPLWVQLNIWGNRITSFLFVNESLIPHCKIIVSKKILVNFAAGAFENGSHFDLTYSGLGSGTFQLSPSSLVLAAGVLSGFKLSSLEFPLKFPAETEKN